MKILFLVPKIDAEHESLQHLRTRGVALLLAENAEEAWKVLQLHGSSVDLAVILQQYASSLIPKIKSNPIQTDLPLILISDGWTDSACAEHQSTAQGANAYLRFPFSGNQIAGLIETVLERPVEKKVASPSNGLPILEDGSGVFLNLDLEEELNGPNFHFEPPEVNRDQTSPSLLLSGPAGTALVPISEDNSNEQSVSENQSDSGLEASLGLSVPIESNSEGGAQSSSVESAPSEESIPLSMELSAVVETSIPVELPSSVGSSTQEGSVAVVEQEGSVGASLEGALNAAKAAAEATLPVGPPSSFPESTAETANLPLDDAQTRQEMPYLFGTALKEPSDKKSDSFLFAEAVGDAVIPGGVVNSPDLETFKKYLLLREQDVAVLSTQLRASQSQIALLEALLREEKAKVVELTHISHEQKVKIDDFSNEKQHAVESLNSEISEISFQLKAKTDKARLLENQVTDVLEEMEHLKERVRLDIRKIRVREKELENRLEIVKKDSEALINARETKIIELKRKIDMLEFNMDLLQNQYAKEKETSSKLRERFAKAAQVVRVAGGLLDSPKSGEGEVRVSSNFDEEDQKVS